MADEVRALAKRSAEAAQMSTQKIQTAIDRTAEGAEINARVAQALAEMVSKARHVDELAAEVAVASQEQSQGIAQVNIAVGQMDKVTQSNAAAAEESAAIAQELSVQAEEAQAVRIRIARPRRWHQPRHKHCPKSRGRGTGNFPGPYQPDNAAKRFRISSSTSAAFDTVSAISA